MKISLSILLLAITLLPFVACSRKRSSSLVQNDGKTIIGGDLVSADNPISRSSVFIFDKLASTSCTGTILSEDLIVTAAHCVGSGAAAQVIFFGTQIALTNEGIPKLLQRSATKVETHPRYKETEKRLTAYLKALQAQKLSADDLKAAMFDYLNHNPDNGDIALLRFSGGLPFGYQPAKILPANLPLPNGARITLAGYGITTSPSEQTPADEAAPANLEETDVTTEDVAYGVTEVLVNQTQNRGACHGDSGGPAFVREDGELYAWGVTSRGVQDPDNTCLSFAIYTNLLAYGNWLGQAANNMGSHLNF